MVPISSQLSKLKDYVNRIEDVLDVARGVPFSNKISIDKDEMHDILDNILMVIDDMQKDIPNEIQHAKRVLSDNDKIVSDARSKAKMIIENANEEIAKLTNDHEITKRAVDQASIIIDEEKRNAREIRLNAMEYADEILENWEVALREAIDMLSKRYNSILADFSETADLLYTNRQELRTSVSNSRGDN